MASMVDSRTVLDAPGAEDLIGRGDMLYQPVDLPRPVRMQGVFVSDARGHAPSPSTGSTRPAAGRSTTRTILAFGDGEEGGGGGGQFAWLRKLGVDEMTVPRRRARDDRAARPARRCLQTKLKLGFARASRVMDELERYGIVGPQDPRNPATPRADLRPGELAPRPSTTSTTGTTEAAGRRPAGGRAATVGYPDRPTGATVARASRDREPTRARPRRDTR